MLHQVRDDPQGQALLKAAQGRGSSNANEPNENNAGGAGHNEDGPNVGSWLYIAHNFRLLVFISRKNKTIQIYFIIPIIIKDWDCETSPVKKPICWIEIFNTFMIHLI